jgi:Protein of unknown function (DUF3592)
MGGWFVDIVVGYLITLFRIISRSVRALRSKDWHEASAVVSGASCQSQAYMPRPVAEIVYTYRFVGGFYGGVDEKPFFLEGSAKACADQFKRGDTLIIRVKPGEPETSLVFDEDQTRVNAPPTTTSVPT